MAIHITGIEDFISLTESSVTLLDVRSPSEYAHAHIPGAQSFPVFTDEERKIIGTTYKQEGREVAVKIGLDYFGPKMRGMGEAVEGLCLNKDNNHKVLVHCWRGGMRSEAVAWLLSFYGFEVYLLEGGYKAYRRWVINHWHDQGPFAIIGGYTGSGKTGIIELAAHMGYPVINLEALARHKGSAFGDLDKAGQPSQEMFENRLATELHRCHKQFGNEVPIWIEDESQRIGNINLPVQLFNHWMTCRLYFLNIPFDKRLDHIVAEYSQYSIESLINAIVRIKKRLGPLETKTAIAHLIEGDFKSCFGILLHYYDKHYGKAVNARTNRIQIDREVVDATVNTVIVKNLIP